MKNVRFTADAEGYNLFLIDISYCAQSVRDFYEGMILIPIVLGKHGCNFDLLEEEMPGGILRKIRRYNIELGTHMDGVPCGVNIEEFPKGAKLQGVKRAADGTETFHPLTIRRK